MDKNGSMHYKYEKKKKFNKQIKVRREGSEMLLYIQTNVVCHK